MGIEVLREGKLIQITCPVCKVALSRKVGLKTKELEVTCAACGSLLLWTQDEKVNNRGGKQWGIK